MAPTLSPFTESLLILLNHIAGQKHEAPGFKDIYNQRLYTAEPGKTRDRIVQQTAVWSGRMADGPNFNSAQRSVRCFVDREDGTILAAGSWKAPAKWGGEWASEFSGYEHKHYAEFTRDGGWGYKGDRKAWEDRKES